MLNATDKKLIIRRLFNIINDGIGIVRDAVADGIRQDQVNQFVTPAGDIELRTQDRGSTLVAGFHNIQQVAAFGFFQRIQQPLVDDEQHIFFILCHELTDCAITAGDCILSVGFMV